MEEDFESWSSIIRSCVLSSKVPLTPCEINSDTIMLEGKNIPYRQLNYYSLEDMLKDISGLKVFRVNGKTLVKVIASQETAHIQKMVQLQKNPKKSKKRLQSSPPQRFNNRQPRVYEPVNNRRAKVPFHRPQNQQRRYDSFSPTHFERSRSPSPSAMSSLQLHSGQQEQLSPAVQNILFQNIVQAVPQLIIDPRLMLNNYRGAICISHIPYLHIPHPSYSTNYDVQRFIQ